MGAVGELPGLVVDLRGQFTSGRQDQAHWELLVTVLQVSLWGGEEGRRGRWGGGEGGEGRRGRWGGEEGEVGR